MVEVSLADLLEMRGKLLDSMDPATREHLRNLDDLLGWPPRLDQVHIERGDAFDLIQPVYAAACAWVDAHDGDFLGNNVELAEDRLVVEVREARRRGADRIA